MLEEVVLLAFCFLVTLFGLAVMVVELISGRVFSIDGLWLSLISLTLAAVFGANLAWLLFTVEAQQRLRRFRQGSEPDNPSDEKRRVGA